MTIDLSGTPACPEKLRLLDSYRMSTSHYSMAVRQMSEKRGTTSRESYEHLRKHTEHALKECEVDRLALWRHVATHGC